MRSRLAPSLLTILVLLAPSASIAGAPPAGYSLRSQVRTTPTSPARAVKAFAQCYDKRSAEAMDALLTADYRFHFSEGDLAGAQWATGLSRERELQAARGMFAKYSSISCVARDLESHADPEHPDSASHYQVVVAHKMSYRAVMGAGDSAEVMLTDTGDQIFYLVRGDAAIRVDGQPASADRWYIRHWYEDNFRLNQRLREAAGRCEAVEAMASLPDREGMLSLRAIDNPLCPTLEVACDLPGSEPATLEVYDLAGRRLARRELVPAHAGSTMQVEAGSGTRFAPGAYFLRLTQGQRAPGKKMVLVAK